MTEKILFVFFASLIVLPIIYIIGIHAMFTDLTENLEFCIDHNINCSIQFEN